MRRIICALAVLIGLAWTGSTAQAQLRRTTGYGYGSPGYYGATYGRPMYSNGYYRAPPWYGNGGLGLGGPAYYGRGQVYGLGVGIH